MGESKIGVFMSQVIKITEKNYEAFDAMVYWRIHGKELNKKEAYVLDIAVQETLKNPNLHVYAIEENEKMVGWISLIYLPKVGKFLGKGHVYVDELWVHPSCRGKGYGRILMSKADELKETYDASGIRLYVSTTNDSAIQLYKNCDFQLSGEAYFMTKE